MKTAELQGKNFFDSTHFRGMIEKLIVSEMIGKTGRFCCSMDFENRVNGQVKISAKRIKQPRSVPSFQFKEVSFKIVHMTHITRLDKYYSVSINVVKTKKKPKHRKHAY